MKRMTIKLVRFLPLGIVTVMGLSACKKDRPQVMYGVPTSSYHTIGQDPSSPDAPIAPLQDE